MLAIANKGEHITQSHAQDNRNYLPHSKHGMLVDNLCFRSPSPPQEVNQNTGDDRTGYYRPPVLAER